MNAKAILIPVVALAGGYLLWQLLVPASPTTPPSPYAIKDGVQIPVPVVPRLRALAEAFHAATGHRFTVTDGTRRPEDQALLMVRNLDRGDDLSLYANKAAAAQVAAAWQAAREADQADAEVVEAVAAVIRSQVANQVYVSKHLREGAVDVRSHDMTDGMRATFKALAGAAGVDVVDETKTTTPHYHLNF